MDFGFTHTGTRNEGSFTSLGSDQELGRPKKARRNNRARLRVRHQIYAGSWKVDKYRPVFGQGDRQTDTAATLSGNLLFITVRRNRVEFQLRYVRRLFGVYVVTCAVVRTYRNGMMVTMHTGSGMGCRRWKKHQGKCKSETRKCIEPTRNGVS